MARLQIIVAACAQVPTSPVFARTATNSTSALTGRPDELPGDLPEFLSLWGERGVFDAVAVFSCWSAMIFSPSFSAELMMRTNKTARRPTKLMMLAVNAAMEGEVDEVDRLIEENQLDREELDQRLLGRNGDKYTIPTRKNGTTPKRRPRRPTG